VLIFCFCYIFYLFVYINFYFMSGVFMSDGGYDEWESSDDEAGIDPVPGTVRYYDKQLEEARKSNKRGSQRDLGANILAGQGAGTSARGLFAKNQAPRSPQRGGQARPVRSWLQAGKRLFDGVDDESSRKSLKRPRLPQEESCAAAAKKPCGGSGPGPSDDFDGPGGPGGSSTGGLVF
jgi:hypothetical protein